MFIKTISGNYINANLLIKIYINTEYRTPKIGTLDCIDARDCTGTVHHISEHENKVEAEKALEKLIETINYETQNVNARVQIC